MAIMWDSWSIKPALASSKRILFPLQSEGPLAGISATRPLSIRVWGVGIEADTRV